MADFADHVLMDRDKLKKIIAKRMGVDVDTSDILNTPIARGGILPFTEYADRSEFDLTSGLPGAFYDALTAPARAYRGELSEDQQIPEAFNFAGSLTLGNLLSGAAAPIKNNAMAAYKALGPQDASADTLRTARIAGADRFVIDDAATAFANKRPSTLTGDDLLDMLRASGMGPANSNSATAELFANAKTGAAVPLATRALEGQQSKGITAYHGSPHDFDRFSMEHIGTGEGAQAYGHGLYFAENEGVARSYRDALGGATDGEKVFTFEGNKIGQFDGIETFTPETLAARFVAEHGGDVNAAVAHQEDLLKFMPKGYAKDLRQSGVDALKSQPDRYKGLAWQDPGHMYEVRINADPEDFLDWDKPLSQQSEKVRGLFNDRLKSGGMESRPIGRGSDGVELFDVSQTGGGSFGVYPKDKVQSVLERPVDYYPDSTTGRDLKEFSGLTEDTLREAGIPGIRYLDQMSRGAGEGSSNYVVFDDALIEILRKYGLLPPIAAGAAVAGTDSDEGGIY